MRIRNRHEERFGHIRRKYGLTEAGYLSLWDRQGGLCAICGRILVDLGHNGVHVDHGHDTGAVRGLLCAWCNRGLGQFMDSPDILRIAAEYLKGDG